MKIKVNSSSAPVNLDINELHIHQRLGHHHHHHHHDHDNPHALVVYQPPLPITAHEPEELNVPDDSCQAGCFNVIKIIGGVVGALVKGFAGV